MLYKIVLWKEDQTWDSHCIDISPRKQKLTNKFNWIGKDSTCLNCCNQVFTYRQI